MDSLALAGILAPVILIGLLSIALIGFCLYNCYKRKSCLLPTRIGVSDLLHRRTTSDEEAVVIDDIVLSGHATIGIDEDLHEGDERTTYSSFKSGLPERARRSRPPIPTASESSFRIINENAIDQKDKKTERNDAPPSSTVMETHHSAHAAPVDLLEGPPRDPLWDLDERWQKQNGGVTVPTNLHFDDFDKFCEHIRNSERRTNGPYQPNYANFSPKPSMPQKLRYNQVCALEPQPSTSASSQTLAPHRIDDDEDNFEKYDLATSKRKSNEFVSFEEKCLQNKMSFMLTRVENGSPQNELQMTEIEKCLDLVRSLHETLYCGKKLSLPEHLSKMELDHGLNYLQELQKPRTKVENSVPLAQKLLLLDKKQSQSLFYKEKAWEPGSNIIIGVDATPSHFGGYCVNLKEKKLEFYVIRSGSIPWIINEKHCSDEFEMKNFLLALSIWHKEIEELKRFSIFTDNLSVVDSKHFGENAKKYGKRVRKLIQHFEKCKGAKLCGLEHRSMFINRTKDLVPFAKFIQPADDLSRLEVKSCVDFLCEMYDIEKENVMGTCDLQISSKRVEMGRGKQWEQKLLNLTYFHTEALKRAKTFIETFECSHCKEAVDLKSSIRITTRSNPSSQKMDTQPIKRSSPEPPSQSPDWAITATIVKKNKSGKKKRNRQTPYTKN